ncbi:hypothetical protein DdX_21204 [Ditylenchus destructor]|uniref:Uncharacterized protein n=1 Tax=Ditylenchus destructor TaxID=166010 RepID=A0AAD4QVH9_9BILA|nr:hypothetical protein DdX_21204 [Ditylenchus destructor]
MIIFAVFERRKRAARHDQFGAAHLLRSGPVGDLGKARDGPLLPWRTDLSVSAPPLKLRCTDRSCAKTLRRTSPVTPCAPMMTASVTGESLAKDQPSAFSSPASAAGASSALLGTLFSALDGLLPACPCSGCSWLHAP